MPQIKKPDLREAILAAAYDLFARKGYSATKMAEIARAAGMTVANLYIYFPSKFDILFETYRPWKERQLAELKSAVEKFRTPRTRLRRILLGIWHDIPAADHGFASALIEGLAVEARQLGGPTELLGWSEKFLTGLIAESLPPTRQHLAEGEWLSHVLWMAFDGFAIGRRLSGESRHIEAIADSVVALLLGDGAADQPLPLGTAATAVVPPTHGQVPQKLRAMASDHRVGALDLDRKQRVPRRR